MGLLQQYGPLLARIFLASVFIVAGVQKIVTFDGTVQFIQSAGLPMATLLAGLAIVIELGGGIMLILGYKTKIAATALFVFILATILIFHLDFPEEQGTFLKNLSVAGGMLLLMAYGSGPVCLDRQEPEVSPGEQTGDRWA